MADARSSSSSDEAPLSGSSAVLQTLGDRAHPLAMARLAAYLCCGAGVLGGILGFGFGTFLAFTLVELPDQAYRWTGGALFLEGLLVGVLATRVKEERSAPGWLGALVFVGGTAVLAGDLWGVGVAARAWAGLQALLFLPLLRGLILLGRAGESTPAPEPPAESKSETRRIEREERRRRFAELPASESEDTSELDVPRRESKRVMRVVTRPLERVRQPVAVRLACEAFGEQVLRPGDALTIGRKAGNDIVLEDATVSRFHATVVWLPDESFPYVEDEGSANGLLLDGERLDQRTYLENDGRLKVGKFGLEITLIEEESPVA